MLDQNSPESKYRHKVSVLLSVCCPSLQSGEGCTSDFGWTMQTLVWCVVPQHWVCSQRLISLLPVNLGFLFSSEFWASPVAFPPNCREWLNQQEQQDFFKWKMVFCAKLPRTTSTLAKPLGECIVIVQGPHSDRSFQHAFCLLLKNHHRMNVSGKEMLCLPMRSHVS